MSERELHDRPQAVTAAAGDRLTLRLPENPTTGYRWSATVRGDAIELVSSELLAGPAGRPGAGGERVIVLRATHPGHGEAEFRLARSWAPDAPAEHWRLGVTVEP